MSERRSRCTIQQTAPYEWREYIDDNHPSVQKLAAWLERLQPFNRNHFLGEFDGLKELATRGEIRHGEPETVTRIKPLRNRPEMWELRWTMLRKKIRQYHGEPDTEPNVLVSLHMHMKPDFGLPRAAARKLQDQEIRAAARRYKHGRPHRWK